MTNGHPVMPAGQAPVPHELVRIVAHDVRAPLQTIAMATDMIDARAGSEADARRYAEIIRAAVRQVDRIVEELLVSGAHEWAPTVGRPVMDVAAVLDDALEQYVAMADLKAVTLRVDPPAVPVWVAVARGPLLRALANLLANAIRHTPPGGSVRIAAQPLGVEVAVIVADNGSGMPQAELDELLRRSAAGAGGPGLHGNGLAIVQGIARQAGGRLTAVTRPGVGSTFTILLPEASPPGDLSR